MKKLVVLLCLLTLAACTDEQARSYWDVLIFDTIVKNELDSWNINGEHAVSEFVDPDADQEWRQQLLAEGRAGFVVRPDLISQITVTNVIRDEMNALVEVNILPDGMDVSLRQSLFYKFSGDRWSRTSPPITLWGKEETLTTPLFTIQYRLLDKDSVLEATPILEQQYLTIQDFLGLRTDSCKGSHSFAEMGDRTRLQLTVTPHPSLLMQEDMASEWIAIESPYTEPAYAHESKTDVLLRGALNALITDLTRTYEKCHDINRDPNWEYVKVGLRDWLVEVHLHSDLRLAGREYPLRLLTRDFQRQLALADLLNPIPPDNLYLVTNQRAASASLFDYVAESFDEHTLRTFTRKVLVQSEWEALIPEVFGVTVSQFEQEWNTYLAEKYTQ